VPGMRWGVSAMGNDWNGGISGGGCEAVVLLARFKLGNIQQTWRQSHPLNFPIPLNLTCTYHKHIPRHQLPCYECRDLSSFT